MAFTNEPQSILTLGDALQQQKVDERRSAMSGCIDGTAGAYNQFFNHSMTGA
ncbi:MAG: hypothetical protein WAW42_00500 [Candidatus Competibacteraceae bacterium]